jgi:hypothetical protein
MTTQTQRFPLKQAISLKRFGKIRGRFLAELPAAQGGLFSEIILLSTLSVGTIHRVITKINLRRMLVDRYRKEPEDVDSIEAAVIVVMDNIRTEGNLIELHM